MKPKCKLNMLTMETVTMHRSAKFQAPPNAVDFLLSCEWVFLLCFLGQIVTGQYKS